MTALGDKLKQLRLQRQISQREVARTLGLSHTRWRDFEHGLVHGTSREAIPTPEQIEQIARYFDYPADVLAQLAGYLVEVPEPPPLPTPEDIAVREVEDIFRRLRPELQAVVLDVVRAFRKTIG